MPLLIICDQFYIYRAIWIFSGFFIWDSLTLRCILPFQRYAAAGLISSKASHTQSPWITLNFGSFSASTTRKFGDMLKKSCYPPQFTLHTPSAESCSYFEIAARSCSLQLELRLDLQISSLSGLFAPEWWNSKSCCRNGTLFSSRVKRDSQSTSRIPSFSSIFKIPPAQSTRLKCSPHRCSTEETSWAGPKRKSWRA